MYTFCSRIRYSEVDHHQRLTLPGIINYLQDCTTFHSKDLGLGVECMESRKKAWILSSWQIVVERYPKMGEHIDISTWATGFGGLYGTRNFQILDEEKKAVVSANSIWVFMDIEKGRPAKPKPEDIEAYGIEPALAMDYAPRKIKTAKELTEQKPFLIRRYHIDTNEHVNNCQYVQMALEALEGEKLYRQVRVEYRKSAVYQDIVIPRTALEEERTVAELCNKEGEPYAVVEFKGEM